MPYALSFSEDFFCDGDPEEVRPSHWPTSVYQAILSMRRAKWNEIAREVFDVESDRLDPFILLDRIRQTNTCSNLESPVQVWIDHAGWYDLLVHDGASQPGQPE